MAPIPDLAVVALVLSLVVLANVKAATKMDAKSSTRSSRMPLYYGKRAGLALPYPPPTSSEYSGQFAEYPAYPSPVPTSQPLPPTFRERFLAKLLLKLQQDDDQLSHQLDESDLDSIYDDEEFDDELPYENDDVVGEKKRSDKGDRMPIFYGKRFSGRVDDQPPAKLRKNRADRAAGELYRSLLSSLRLTVPFRGLQPRLGGGHAEESTSPSVLDNSRTWIRFENVRPKDSSIGFAFGEPETTDEDLGTDSTLEKRHRSSKLDRMPSLFGKRGGLENLLESLLEQLDPSSPRGDGYGLGDVTSRDPGARDWESERRRDMDGSRFGEESTHDDQGANDDDGHLSLSSEVSR